MFRTKLLASLQKGSRGGCHRRKPKRPSFVPHLLALEDRTLPSTITVTNLADGGLGSGSLRDAVLQFNADTGGDDDLIQLDAGTYSLTIQNPGGVHETAGFTGDLNLTQTSHRWIIQGAGPSTIIDASQLQDRVFDIVNPGTQVVFQDLVIQGGLAQDNGADGALAGQSDALGGGLLNNNGEVTLDNVVVLNNVARAGGYRPYYPYDGYNAVGGGIYSTSGTLTVTGALITNNQAIGGNAVLAGGQGGSGGGGGLYSTSGALTISGAMIANNQATGGEGGDAFSGPGGAGGSGVGGGLYATAGSLDIADTSIANNQGTGGPAGTGSASGYVGQGGTGQGGGLYVNGSALTISTTSIASNQATPGLDGIRGGHLGRSSPGEGGGLFNSGTLTVSNSPLSGNSDTGYYGYGGGICNLGTLTVSNSPVSGNSASYSGGGIYNGGTLQVSNSTLSDNSASYAGGIYNYNGGTLTVSNSTLSGNTADLNGGGIGNYGTLMVSNSTLSGNSATYAGYGGGGIYNGGTLTISDSTLCGNSGDIGGGIYNGGTLTVTGSTLSRNSAGSYGGSIYNGGTLTISDSTLSGNTAMLNGGGIFTYGTSPVTLTNVTLTANRANTGGSSGSGGGLYVYSGSLAALVHNTLIAGNFRGGTGTTADDVYGTLNSSGDNNLIGDGTGMTGLVDGVNGNQVGTAANPIDPLLGPLADNGGPTLTHALLPGSPAIDAGNNAYATDWDQRGDGYPRIVNDVIDIGAFEYQGAGPRPSPSRSRRGLEARLAELIASLPPAGSHAVSTSPAHSPPQTATISGERPFVPPPVEVSDSALASGDTYFATIFEIPEGQTSLPWRDLEPAGIAWLPVFIPNGGGGR